MTELSVEVKDIGIAVHDGKLRLKVDSVLSGVGGLNGQMMLVVDLSHEQVKYLRKALRVGRRLAEIEESEFPE